MEKPFKLPLYCLSGPPDEHNSLFLLVYDLPGNILIQDKNTLELRCTCIIHLHENKGVIGKNQAIDSWRTRENLHPIQRTVQIGSLK